MNETEIKNIVDKYVRNLEEITELKRKRKEREIRLREIDLELEKE